jgi:hypothetical protein
MKFSLHRIRKGQDTIPVTGNRSAPPARSEIDDPDTIGAMFRVTTLLKRRIRIRPFREEAAGTSFGCVRRCEMLMQEPDL